jgi:hypothetical protein
MRGIFHCRGFDIVPPYTLHDDSRVRISEDTHESKLEREELRILKNAGMKIQLQHVLQPLVSARLLDLPNTGLNISGQVRQGSKYLFGRHQCSDLNSRRSK